MIPCLQDTQAHDEDERDLDGKLQVERPHDGCREESEDKIGQDIHRCEQCQAPRHVDSVADV